MKHLLTILLLSVTGAAVAEEPGESLSNKLHDEYSDLIFQNDEPSAKDSRKTVRVKKSYDSDWLLAPTINAQPSNKKVYHQMLDYDGVKIEAYYSRFNTSDEAYVAGEFLAQSNAAVYSQGTCSKDEGMVLGFQSWCTDNIGEIGMIIVKGTFCLNIFSLDNPSVPFDQKKSAVLELAQIILSKKEKSKR